MNWMEFALVMVAYLIGAVPFGHLIAKSGAVDLRDHGSGNIGATNAARVLGKRAGALTLAGDTCKGALAVWLAVYWGGDSLAVVAAGAAVIGHIFPVYLGFRGGKGVATGFGVLMVLNLPTALIAFVVWLLAARLSHISAVGALTSYGSLPLVTGGLTLAGWATTPGLVWFSCALSALVLVRHKDNIRQLTGGASG